jgi:predicted dehydrogenase
MTASISRRDFLRVGTVASVGVAVLPSAGPLYAAVGANDRIQFGVIGVGAMGTGHLKSLVKRSEQDNIRVVAVSDVYQKRLSNAVSICHGSGYLDYRAVLDRKDIDAVLIATPDHWHAKMAIDAMEAGKHVYLEKPMTLTIEQALAVRNTARRLKKVLQVGAQATAQDAFWKAHEAIKAGRVGKVTWAQGSYNRNARVEAINAPPFTVDPAAGPQATGDDYIDWDTWLGWKFGLAPKILYNGEHFFRWRKYWPYSNGMGTDLLVHLLAPLQIVIAGPDGEYPRRVSGGGGLYIEKDGREIPDVCLTTIDYPSEYSIFLVSALTNDTQLPLRIYGKYGTIDLEGHAEISLELSFNGPYAAEFKERNDGYTEVRLSRQERRDMEGNFIDVIRGKDTLHCNVELGAATLVALKMGVDAYRQSKTLLWDEKKEEVV